MKKTFQENIKFYNKVNNMKSYYDYQTINKEAKNQVKYMNYLLRQNKYIKKPPTLNYIDIDQYRRLVEQQNEEGDNEIIEEDIKEEEKENEDKLNKGEEINGNNNINQNENEENLNKNRNDKKINISTTNNSTKEKNIEHNS